MKILFYYDEDGDVPVRDDLEQLEVDDEEKASAVQRKFRILKNLTYEEALAGPYIKNIRDKVDSLKVRGHQVRILGFRYGDDFVAAVLTIKQQPGLDDEEIVRAQKRREDWYERLGRPS